MENKAKLGYMAIPMAKFGDVSIEALTQQIKKNVLSEKHGYRRPSKRVNPMLAPAIKKFNGKWHITKEELTARNKIIQSTCEVLLLEPEALKMKTSKRKIVEARQIIYYFLKTKEIGGIEWIGSTYGQNHSTVLYGVQTTSNLMQTDLEFREKVQKIKNKIEIND